MSDTSDSPLRIERFSPEKTYQNIKGFDCGDKLLSSYPKNDLKKQVVRENLNALVLTDENDTFIGYSTIKFSQMSKQEVPAGVFPHSLPPLITVMQIPMIAINNDYQGKGWGLQLMRASLEFIYGIAAQVNGIKGVVLDAVPEKIAFYESFDFVPISDKLAENGTMPMMLSIDMLRKVYAQAAHASA